MIAGALWFKENTLNRHPKAAQFLKWFESSDDQDEGSDDDMESSGDEVQYGSNIHSRFSFIFILPFEVLHDCSFGTQLNHLHICFGSQTLINFDI